MPYSQLLVLFLGLLLPATEEADLLERARQALELRKELLNHYSVEVRSRSLMELPNGKQELDSRERHFLGLPGEFRQEVIRLQRNGVTVDSGVGPAGPGRRRLANFFPQLPRPDLLAVGAILEEAEVIGPARLDSTDTIEIRIQPKIPGLRVEEGSLWVDEESGMPLRVELRFGMGAVVSDAKLRLDLAWNGEGEITVPRVQTLEMTRSGFGPRAGQFGGNLGRGARPGGSGTPGGGKIEVSTTWQNYQWNLSFEEGFFLPETRGQPGQRRAQRRETLVEEDPFEEIRISPAGLSSQEASFETEELTEILIEGASVRGEARGGRSEGAIMSRILGGQGGGRGGIRGARIAGSRANRLQGSFTSGMSSSALNAQSYSLDGGATPNPDYFSWSAGVSVGGPLSSSSSSGSPPLSRRRASSFFVDFTTNRGQQLQSRYASVPTLLERQGDFSETVYPSGPLAGTPVEIFDPVTGAAFFNTAIPLQQMNSAALGLLEFIPPPNRQEPFLNFLNQQTLQNTRERLNLRLNSSLSESLRLSGSYNFNRTQSDTFNVFPDLSGERSGRGQNISLSLNQTFAPGFLHNLRLRWNRNRNENLNIFTHRRNVSAELGIENTSPEPIDYGLTTIQFTNYTTLQDGSSSSTVRESNTISDNLQWVKGRHFFRMGGDMGWNRRNRLANPEGTGSQTFAGVATSLYVDNAPVAGTGYDFADFLLGLAHSSRIQYGNSDHYLRSRKFSLFLNDNWRVNSRLTLQWGLRYQYTSPWVERYDRLSNLDVGPGFSQAETVIPGSTGAFFGEFPRALIGGDRNNIAPRVALAYRVQSGRLASVWRANYGVFYPDESYNSLANELISQPPFGFAIQETVEGRDFLEIQWAFADELAEEVSNTYAVDPHFRLSTVQNWNLSWQQTLPHSFFLSVGYAGSRGTGLELLRAPNRVIEGDQRIENAAQFLYLTSGASSAFHGLQLLATRRMRGGFSVSAQYEWGKSLDNAASLTGGGRTVAQNDDDLDSEFGLSSSDERHKLRLNWFLELPFGQRHRWLRDSVWLSPILSNWFVTGTIRATSGRPFTARVLGNQINNSGTGSQASERASVTGEEVDLPSSQRSSQEWFNTAAFRLPDPGTFGDAGRNTINGPGSWTVDLNLARSILLKGEGQRLVIVVETSNLFNQVNYRGLNTVVNSIGFGKVTSAGDMRQIQLKLRWMF
ncbi:MAG: hypothetical protein O6826_05615 [Acidobacteria bacterium]|nr:hypothetical protein [Acidobacteriota bacterium]